MFGFFTWKKIAGQALSFIMGLLAPLGEKLPNQVFADAYVLGFLQIVTMYFVTEVKPNSTPAYVSSLFTYILENIVPPLKGQLRQILLAVNDPSNPYHAHYLVGRRDGEMLMKSRKGIVSPEDGKAALDGFHDFIRRNYINN